MSHPRPAILPSIPSQSYKSSAAAFAQAHWDPPRHRRMGVLNPSSSSLRRASAKLNGQAAALAGPPALGVLFAYALGGAAVTRRRRPQ